MLVCDAAGNGGGLWTAKVTLLCKIGFRRIKDGREYAWLNCIEGKHPKGIVHNMLGCVYSRCGTNDKVVCSLSQGTGALKQSGLSRRKV